MRRPIVFTVMAVMSCVPASPSGASVQDLLSETREAVLASGPLDVIPGCNCAEDRPELSALRDRIGASESVGAARALALEPTSQARSVLGRARWWMPGSESLARADQRLAKYEIDVQQASTVSAVADRYARLVRLPVAGDPIPVPDASSAMMDNCHYSTGEIIAIVLGLLLGIIPGIILLFLLC